MSYFIHSWILKHYLKWVPSFGNLRVNGYLLLTAAYRSLSRPSSAPSAKASALCSSSLDQKCCLTALVKTFSLLQSNCYLTLSESFLFFWFLGLTLKLYSDLSEPTKFWKNTLVIFLDFVFVVNFCLYTIFAIQFSRYKWWRIRGSNPWPPACKAGALPAELIPHKLIAWKLKSP